MMAHTPSRVARAFIALLTLLLMPGLLLRLSGAQRAGGPPNESHRLPILTPPVRIPPDWTIKVLPTAALGASYPRAIQLKHHAQGRGQILLTFAGVPGAMPIYRSTGNGETFELFSELKELRGQPALFELPTKVGDFPAGTILAAGGLAQDDPAKRMLAANYTTDGGKTGQHLSVVAEGGPGRYDPADRAGLSLHQNPVLEPYLYTDGKGQARRVFFG